MTEVEIIQVTWMRAIKVWWSLLWRFLLFGLLIGISLGFILGFLMGLFRASPEAVRNVCVVVAYIIYIPLSVVVTKLVLQRRYSDFRIALINDKQ